MQTLTTQQTLVNYEKSGLYNPFNTNTYKTFVYTFQYKHLQHICYTNTYKLWKKADYTTHSIQTLTKHLFTHFNTNTYNTFLIQTLINYEKKRTIQPIQYKHLQYISYKFWPFNSTFPTHILYEKSGLYNFCVSYQSVILKVVDWWNPYNFCIETQVLAFVVDEL